MMDVKQLEKLEVLDGSRGGKGQRRAAVRIEDIAPLLELIPTLKSTSVSAAPTEDEHNALVADVKAIHQRLTAIRELLQARIIR